jgi:hypothetical protein
MVQQSNANTNEGIQAIYRAEYRTITAFSAAIRFAKISYYNKESGSSPTWHDKC